MAIVEDLHALFLIDQQVRGLSRGLNIAESRVKSQQARLDQINRQLAELNDQLKHALAAAANLEVEAASCEQRIARLREQMNAARSNKEYSAMLVEINTFKVDKGKLEEQALGHLTKADDLKAQIDQVRQQADEQEKLKQLAEQKLSERQTEVGAELEQVKSRRQSLARQIPPEPLSVFEKLCESTDGEALAPVEQEDPKSDYTCGGCYMALPFERVNQLASTQQLVRCPSCGRILYLASETREMLSGS